MTDALMTNALMTNKLMTNALMTYTFMTENTIDTTKIRNNYVVIQSFIFPILR